MQLVQIWIIYDMGLMMIIDEYYVKSVCFFMINEHVDDNDKMIKQMLITGILETKMLM